MKTIRTTCLIFGVALVLQSIPEILRAQTNDDCGMAINIANPSSYCSDSAAVTNLNATSSNVPLPACFSNDNQDVWFSFTAVASQLTFVVNGSSSLVNGGLLRFPMIALYSGDCPGNLTEIGCATDVQHFYNILELHAADLVVGQKYYIRVASVVPNTFQYCIYNFRPNGQPSADCPTAVFLCDKSSFNVTHLQGAGNDPNEMEDAGCFTGIFGVESNSSWYVFTADNNGNLEFKLSPNNKGDDLDFVVYELPNGPGNCTPKFPVRCMAAGDFTPYSPCMGPTGLDNISTATSAPPGCDTMVKSNFLQALPLTAGKTYALVVNNLTSTLSGFQVDWGGTALFRGPKIGFKADKPDTVCLYEKIVFTDTSSYANGTIDKHLWTFGSGATLDSSATKGPHEIHYTTTGLKTITLSIHTPNGCQQDIKKTILVQSCCALKASVTVGPDCPPDTTCSKATVQVENDDPPLKFNWSTGQTDTSITNLKRGTYTVTVADARGCTTSVTFTVLPRKVFINIPNVFTPNNDGLNDQFYPIVSEIEILEFQIYDRWGKLLHNDASTHWDGMVNGKEAPSDVYVYRILAKWPDGHQEVKKGGISLLR
jgi:gliding motility-associated-like protein